MSEIEEGMSIIHNGLSIIRKGIGAEPDCPP